MVTYCLQGLAMTNPKPFRRAARSPLKIEDTRCPLCVVCVR